MTCRPGRTGPCTAMQRLTVRRPGRPTWPLEILAQEYMMYMEIVMARACRSQVDLHALRSMSEE